ncbi:MAG: DUF1461 domain-containing protein [Candidatus Atribacteria bacterium]|nr:DUF1461 domain-containing protein [Candidatus Atribacteria bacterium]
MIILLPVIVIVLAHRAIFNIIYNLFLSNGTAIYPKPTYLNTVDKVIGYFFNTQRYLQIDGITEIEQIHMLDVKKLIIAAFLMFIVTLIIVILNKRFITKGFLKVTATFLLIASGILIILSFTSFDTLFTYFHKILFRNNYWLLDENSILIRLFPESVFTFLGIFWFGFIIIASLIMLIL